MLYWVISVENLRNLNKNFVKIFVISFYRHSCHINDTVKLICVSFWLRVLRQEKYSNFGFLLFVWTGCSHTDVKGT